eukprot:3709633-Amphidinium_carterae.1
MPFQAQHQFWAWSAARVWAQKKRKLVQFLFVCSSVAGRCLVLLLYGSRTKQAITTVHQKKCNRQLLHAQLSHMRCLSREHFQTDPCGTQCEYPGGAAKDIP